MAKQVYKWQSKDGKLFDSEADCDEYDAECYARTGLISAVRAAIPNRAVASEDALVRGMMANAGLIIEALRYFSPSHRKQVRTNVGNPGNSNDG